MSRDPRYADGMLSTAREAHRKVTGGNIRRRGDFPEEIETEVGALLLSGDLHPA